MIFISLKEASKFYKITIRTLHRKVKSGLYISRQVKGNGGMRYEIALTGADEKRYLGIPEPQIDLSDLNAMSGYIRDYVMEYELILKETNGMDGAEIAHYCATKNPLSPHIKLSVSTLYRKRSLFRRYGRSGIVPAWGSSGKTAITPEQLDYFKRLYFKENGPSAELCRIISFGKFKKENPKLSINEFPSARAFLRRIRTVVCKPYIDLARKGERHYKRTYEYYVARDWSGTPAGKWFVSDHHQLDVLCVDQYGSNVRPWVTAWMDLRTNKFVSTWLHPESPNSDHIFMTLAWAVEKYGLPDGAYLDNGKDYRSRDFTGNPKRYGYWNEDAEQKARNLFNQFDIEVRFAREYNAQAKPIEPRFKQVIARFSKLFPGYTGSNTATRPDCLQNEIKNKTLLSFEEVRKLFDDYIENIYNKTVSNGKLLNGLSPNQAWDKYRSEIIRRPSEESMRLLYMRGMETTIGRRGIVEKLNGIELSWWTDEFYSLRGTRVYVKRDMRAYNKAYVFAADTNEFLCIAHMDSRMPGIATDIDKTELRETIKRKNRDLRLARGEAKMEQVDVLEMLENEKLAVMAIGEKNKIIPASAGTEVIVSTEFDRIRNDLRKKETLPQVDLSEITPDLPPHNEHDDIDVWGLKSINEY